MKIRIGTRSSQLALAQTNKVAALLSIQYPELNCEIVKIQTSGDKFLDQNLATIGGKGLFLKEIENEMLAGNVDIAVHSLKDVPAMLPEGLEISCFLSRDDARDVLISKDRYNFQTLPEGATVGTSSPRRVLQLQMLRPDLHVVNLRGNINSRLAKVEVGQMDACVLAYAGLYRLNMHSRIDEVMSIYDMIPAIGQGIVCVEHRKEDEKIKQMLQSISSYESERAAQIERDFMISLNGSCNAPIAAYSYVEHDAMNLLAIYSENGKILKKQYQEPLADCMNLGKLAANDMLVNLR
ncbi:MAG: hydroxymethylbilane synthase [Alphaproteobacteria bacterium]|jgi:hydroxymethylbilane synthase|nr:hydroxymethylbilane synthase [Candidatus Jidaibacter sp.]